MIGPANAVIGNDRDANVVGVGTAAMSVTANIVGMDLARCEMTRALTVQVQVLVQGPVPATLTLDAQTAHATGVTKAKGVKACQTRGGMIRGCTLFFRQ